MTKEVKSTKEQAIQHKVNADKSVTITLNYSIEYDGKKYTEITIRRSKFGDVKAVESIKTDNEIERTMALIALLGDLPELAIEDLDMQDVGEINQVIKGFLVKSPVTTKK